MGELWRKTSEVFWGKPLLWLPVLAADLLGSGFDEGQKAIVRAVVASKTTYQSALGGPAQHVALTQQTLQQAAQVAIPLQWTTNFVRILLYAIALAVTASMVRDVLNRSREPWTLGSALQNRWGRLLGLALRVLALAVVFTVLFGWTTRWMILSNHKAVVASPWFHLATALVLMLAIAWVTAPSAVRAVANGAISSEGGNQATMMAFLLGAASLALAFFVQQSAPAIVHLPDSRRIPVEMVASLVTAVPYILMFVGFGVLADNEDRARTAAIES